MGQRAFAVMTIDDWKDLCQKIRQVAMQERKREQAAAAKATNAPHPVASKVTTRGAARRKQQEVIACTYAMSRSVL